VKSLKPMGDDGEVHMQFLLTRRRRGRAPGCHLTSSTRGVDNTDKLGPT
jgi:hypothetical protein